VIEWRAVLDEQQCFLRRPRTRIVATARRFWLVDVDDKTCVEVDPLGPLVLHIIPPRAGAGYVRIYTVLRGQLETPPNAAATTNYRTARRSLPDFVVRATERAPLHVFTMEEPRTFWIGVTTPLCLVVLVFVALKLPLLTPLVFAPWLAIAGPLLRSAFLTRQIPVVATDMITRPPSPVELEARKAAKQRSSNPH
jgi:hypothetical protein